jgi:hypothetical protein
MPAIANIVVKKADGVTDVTYTGIIPSSGDKNPAVWRDTSMGTAHAFRPEFRMKTQDNGNHTERQVEISFTYPQLVTNTTTGITSVNKRCNFTLRGTVPAEMPATDVAEAIAQGYNLVASALIKSASSQGYAPT